MPNQSMGWWSTVVCDSFVDETYVNVTRSGNNGRGRIVRGRIVSVQFYRLYLKKMQTGAIGSFKAKSSNMYNTRGQHCVDYSQNTVCVRLFPTNMYFKAWDNRKTKKLNLSLTHQATDG
jgi:hypothetical protein